MTPIQEYVGITEKTQEFLDNCLLSLDSFLDTDQEKIKQIARECAASWNLPYRIALDYVLIDISKRVMKKRDNKPYEKVNY